MKEKIINKILGKIKERKEEDYKNSKIYEDKSQVAYNSTFYSKNDARLWFGGITQILLTFCMAGIIKNPAFSIIKSFINPVSATLILVPISFFVGELTRKYLARDSKESLKKLDITKKTPDYIKVANEIYYKAKASIATKNYEIDNKVLENISTKDINNNTYSYSKIVDTNDALNRELKDYKEQLEKLIIEQVLCLEYKVNRTYKRMLLSQARKGLTVSTIISTLLLSGIILIGSSYYSFIPNLDLVIKNILINYIGTITFLTPGLVLYFNHNYILQDRTLKDVVNEKPQLEDFVDTVRRQELVEEIYTKYSSKSNRELKKYFDKEINRLTNKIVELQTSIDTNNISINILREEAMQKLTKKRRTNSIKPKVVTEENTRIRFRGKVKQLIPSN